MTLVLHQHPFASYCQKVLIALYELGLPFESVIVDDDAARVRHAEMWPMGSIPVLRDESADLTLPESTTIIEHLDENGRLFPDNLSRYYRDLVDRPSFARVIEEARPFREVFPLPWPEDQDDLG
jgi:glutathione S-transferase